MVSLGLAALCWSLWRTRNTACFEKKMARASKPGGLLHVSLDPNVGYFAETSRRELLMQGAHRLARMATVVFSKA